MTKSDEEPPGPLPPRRGKTVWKVSRFQRPPGETTESLIFVVNRLGGQNVPFYEGKVLPIGITGGVTGALVRCGLVPRTPPELKEKHCFFNASEEIRGGPVGDACSRAV